MCELKNCLWKIIGALAIHIGFTLRHYFSSFKIFNYRVWRVNLSIYQHFETVKKEKKMKYIPQYVIFYTILCHSVVTF